MNTVEKGDRLEDQLYEFLLDQFRQDDLVFDVYPSALCEVYKKKYFCAERGGDVEFDVVVEVRRKGRSQPHIFLVFECKNHGAPVQERDVTDFSDKVRRIFGHAGKGVIFSASRLQSGAESIARSRRLGIAKFDANGIDVVADRAIGPWAESGFLKAQLVDGPRLAKSLKFSAYSDGKYFCSPLQFLMSFDETCAKLVDRPAHNLSGGVPFVSEEAIETAVKRALSNIKYMDGEVDLKKVCDSLGVSLKHSDRKALDADGNLILGSINFDSGEIEVGKHDNRKCERFTVAHEIGHFCLNHGEYLRSETIVERDLFVTEDAEDTFNYERLEYQANIFGSLLLLPGFQFAQEVKLHRQRLNYIDKGFGYIFVDDQSCNLTPYIQLLSSLSDHFGASNQVV